MEPMGKPGTRPKPSAFSNHPRHHSGEGPGPYWYSVSEGRMRSVGLGVWGFGVLGV